MAPIQSIVRWTIQKQHDLAFAPCTGNVFVTIYHLGDCLEALPVLLDFGMTITLDTPKRLAFCRLVRPDS